jgi:phosphate-selective porin OprO/OprP
MPCIAIAVIVGLAPRPAVASTSGTPPVKVAKLVRMTFASAETQAAAADAAPSKPPIQGTIGVPEDMVPQRLIQAPASATPEPSTYEKIWTRFSQWHKDESNPIVQQVLFTGRFHYDVAAVDADQGDLTEWNVRRLRLGHRVTLFRSFTLHAEVELDPQERDPFYLRITDAYLQWNKSSRVVMTFGKQALPFTNEGATSSRDLLTMDRSNLANNFWFPQEYMPGVSVSGRQAPWVYRGGVYSAGAMNREFGEFTGDYITLALLGYDFAKRIGLKEAVLTGNYVYQHPDPDNTFTRPSEHVLSVHSRVDGGWWGVRTDLSYADGYLGQSDMWAAMAMPFFNVTDQLQAVGRYTYIDSVNANGIRLATYESRVVSGRGDKYNELYLGANYYFYGHRLKLQTGVQWADMNDRARDGGEYSGVSWTTGLRVGW